MQENAKKRTKLKFSKYLLLTYKCTGDKVINWMR